MSYFLSQRPLQTEQEVELTGEEVVHLFARRARVGERVDLQGPDFKRFRCEVIKVGLRSVRLRVLTEVAVPAEPVVPITLLQALVNEQALDFILQKSTELGAFKIILFNAANTAAKLTTERVERKLPRWQKILWEAAKQCDRLKPPQLEFVPEFNELLGRVTDLDQLIVLDIAGEKFSQSTVLRSKSVGIAIGPEGGFTAGEIEKFKAFPHHQLMSLGPRLLRAETAAIAGLAICQNRFN